MVIQRLKERFKTIPWRKVGLGLLVFGLMVLSFLGGHLSVDWYLQARERGTGFEREYADWQVYKSDTYGFGLRYPNNWEAKEIKANFITFKPQPGESFDSAQDKEESAPSGYIDLVITSNKNRGSAELTIKGKTACEEDQSKCSFHTNGIFGERITTPEIESVFFAHGENDFTLTLHKYLSPAVSSTLRVENSITPKADSSAGSAETIDYVSIFEAMAESSRFTSQITTACEKDAECTLGIRLDECCSCAEAFTKSEVEVNSAIAIFEADKDYSGEKVVDCSSSYCSPCPTPPSGAVCVSNRCQVKEE